jgi:hypothetical protein
MKWIVRVLALALALFGMAVPAQAGQGDRPLKGTVTGVANFLSDTACAPVNLRTVSDATGIVTHLGRVVSTSRHCTPPGAEISGRMTLTAANGDELYLDYTGTCVPDTPELTAGETYFVCENPFEVGGGTGRFEDATGSGNISARVLFAGFEAPDWPGSWTVTGTFRY